jgi:hypothetical protein
LKLCSYENGGTSMGLTLEYLIEIFERLMCRNSLETSSFKGFKIFKGLLMSLKELSWSFKALQSDSRSFRGALKRASK